MYLSDNCDSKCLRCSGSDHRVPFLLPVLFTTQGAIPNHASCGGHECVWFLSPLLSSFVPIISIILDGISIDIPLVILPSYPYSVPTDIEYYGRPSLRVHVPSVSTKSPWLLHSRRASEARSRHATVSSVCSPPQVLLQGSYSPPTNC